MDEIENGFRKIFLLNQSDVISVELTFWNKDGNKKKNMMRYIFRNKQSLFYVICLHYYLKVRIRRHF